MILIGSVEMNEIQVRQDAVVEKSAVADSVVLQRLIAEVASEPLPVVSAVYNRTYNRHNR